MSTSVSSFAKVAPNLARGALLRALKLGQFVPYFQPQVCLETGRVVGVEVLARWQHPEYGLLSPQVFLEAIERHRLTAKLFAVMLDGALGHVHAWSAKGWGINVSVNCSPECFKADAFVISVLELCERHAVSPAQVTVEVTDSIYPKSHQSVLNGAVWLRQHGFGLSIDDFGTGYSSLLHLKEFPFTELKLDRSLLSDLQDPRKGELILHSILALANSLGLRTVAEGIANDAQFDMLRRLGCELGQSYAIARPMAAHQMSNYLSASGVTQGQLYAA